MFGMDREWKIMSPERLEPTAFEKKKQDKSSNLIQRPMLFSLALIFKCAYYVIAYD